MKLKNVMESDSLDQKPSNPVNYEMGMKEEKQINHLAQENTQLEITKHPSIIDLSTEKEMQDTTMQNPYGKTVDAVDKQKENYQHTCVEYQRDVTREEEDDSASFMVKEDRELTQLRHVVTRSRPYDAFVSFHHSRPHRNFVFDKILPELEENHNPRFQLYIHDRDFELGQNIIQNIETAIHNSNSAIIVMSQGYVGSKWCQIEFRECYLESALDPAFRIFVIMMEPEEPLQNTSIYMRKFFRETTYGLSSDPKLFQKIGKLLIEIQKQIP